MMLDQLPLLLTVEEAAEVMRISRTGAYNAVAEGSLPAIRIGRSIRIPRDRLAELLGLDAPAANGDGDASAPDGELDATPQGELRSGSVHRLPGL